MKNVFEGMRNEFSDIYKNYRIGHFSMTVMKDIYYKNMDVNKIDSFTIRDESLNETIGFTTTDIEGCSENGKYQRILAGTTLAVIYQLWEEKFRTAIANEYQLKKNDIISDFFGDLRLIRQAVIHNNFQPIDDLNKIKLLHFLGNKEQLNLTSLELSKTNFLLNKEIDRLDMLHK
ncbi:hypothetical protein [Leeuwenhoekiella sp. W20_SRS_FM14]|uniref:hypothetical protein n=1 Tax=Leeuwenhoekiella sp. W20_SRS_FM14 TaxID=3240270 RepID=UPI003F99B992